MNPKSALYCLFIPLLLCLNVHAEEDGVTKDKVVFGRSTNISGKSTSSFIERGWGIEAYLKRVNDHGGVHGRKIEIAELDDGYEPRRAYENAKKFIEELKVFGLYGYAGTPSMQAVIPYIKNTNVPFIALNAAHLLRQPVIKNVFTVRAGYQDELNLMVKHAADKLKKTKFAIFYQDDAYGKEGVNGLARELPKRGLTLVASASYNRNETQVDAPFRALMKANPEVVIVFAQAVQSGLFLKLAHQANWKPLIYLTGNQATTKMLKETGSAVELAYVTQSLPDVNDLSIPVVKDFNRDMKELNHPIGGVGFEGYLGAIAIVEALKRVGKNLTRDKFNEAMEKLNGFDFGGIKSEIGPKDHQTLGFVYLTRFKDMKPYKAE